VVVPVGLPGPGLEEDVLQHEVVMVVVHEGKQVQLTRILALDKKFSQLKRVRYVGSHNFNIRIRTLAFHFDVDPNTDPASHFNADLDPAPRQCNANFQSLNSRPSVKSTWLQCLSSGLNGDPPRLEGEPPWLHL